MSPTQPLIMELEQEAAATQRVLEAGARRQARFSPNFKPLE